jgi:iron complex outermembrane receptor protein
MNRSLNVLLLAFVASLAPTLAGAEAPPPVIEVSGTRTGTAPFDTPASVDIVGAEALHDGLPQISLSESLAAVPGLLARDRQNFAQDVQLSVRGFGARASFGIRGVRLLVDGIPATLPDGQGQLSHIDLGSAERIEVLRGPFSVLHGNASGGVLQVFTEEGRGPPQLSLALGGGAHEAWRIGAKVSGASGPLGYVLSASEFQTDGSRVHSAARRDIANAKLSAPVSDGDGRWTLVANHLSLPRAQDPLGLTRSQFQADPHGADPAALQFDTRKTVEQTQAGLLYEQHLNASQGLRLMVYAGQRSTEQFQAIPTAPQANAQHPGGVIQLDRDYSGLDARWTGRGQLADGRLTLIAGLAADQLQEHRRGLQNFIGSTLGVEGALRRDEDNRVSNLDPYLQAQWQATPVWSATLGVRRAQVRVNSTDHYIVGANGDDSGSARYSATLPVLGVMAQPSEQWRFYATVGRGFETPTLNELAYRAGGSGLNFALQPARSDNAELGAKAHLGAHELAAALFETRTDNEIVTQTNSGGRATYQNAGRTRRRGAELSWNAALSSQWQAQAAYTLLDAVYRDAFVSCNGSPCVAQTIPAGNRLPGLARHALHLGLAWGQPQGWRAGVGATALSSVAVNDLNTDAAGAYAVADARLGYETRLGPWALGGFVRIDNLFNRRYAGSVIVNEGNGRYFEPAPGRSGWVGFNAQLAL